MRLFANDVNGIHRVTAFPDRRRDRLMSGSNTTRIAALNAPQAALGLIIYRHPSARD